MSILVATLVEQASKQLNDIGNVRWPVADHIEAINDGQRELALLRPEAATISTSMSTVNNSIQSLPSDGIALVDVVRDVNGGTAITRVERDILDTNIPDWHSAIGAIRHYTYDPSTPKNFMIYPHPAGSTSLIISYVREFIPVVNGGFTNFPDVFLPAILNYMLYRALSKEEEAAVAQKAVAYYQAFVSLISGADLLGKVDVVPQSHNPNV